MAKVLPPIELDGVKYKVLRLAGGRRGPRFLLRNEAGELFGLFAQNGQPTRLFAAPLAMNLGQPNPLKGIEFFENDGALSSRR